MKLIKCHIENFGKLSDFTYDFTDGWKQWSVQKRQEMLQCHMHTYRNCMFSAKCLLVFQLHSV